MNNYRVTISNGTFWAQYFYTAETEEAAKAEVLKTHNASLSPDEGEAYTKAKAESLDLDALWTSPMLKHSGAEG